MTLFSWQSRRLWVLLLGSAILAAMLAFQLMNGLLPTLKADISFNRQQATAAAVKLHQQLFSDIKTDRLAVSFATDRPLQTYVELEGGGDAILNREINNPDVALYAWNVRQFAESQEQELWVSYSPNGTPLGFALNIPEKLPGAALEADAARAIAEAGARSFLGKRFDSYKAFDSKLIRQPSGRVDHVFTYEQHDLALGEAKFRVDLQVVGDRLVAIKPYNHIPDAFQQRFGEMRALNDQINKAARYAMYALFMFGGVVGGGLWLHRHHQLQWRSALGVGLLLSLGLGAAMVSNLPSAWLGYRTTVSVNNFLLQYAMGIGFGLVENLIQFGALFMVAEGLSRLAFAGQPRLFDFFRQPIAATGSAFGRVLGAYAWVGLFLLYAMLFAVLTRRYLGWWAPADLGSDPNILANWRPALGPIFMALQAGTLEESLFRAIPLSIAALVGARLRIQKPLVLITLVIQAVVFAGAHAFYPNLPGYSRLVELFVPAMLFGVVFLRFGLIPGMVAHFVYDLVLMSLPIFVSSAPQLLIDKILVILAGAAPLLLLAWARFRAGAFTTLIPEWCNGALTARIAQQQATPVATPIQPPSVDSALTRVQLPVRWLLGAALLAGAILIASWMKPPKVEWPQFSVNREQASHIADTELAKLGVVLHGEWHKTLSVSQGDGQARDYIWREAGAATFQTLLGNYLDTAYWSISWRKFDGPVDKRTEAWTLLLRPDGQVQDVIHELPEANAGIKLTREQATSVAMQWIVAHQWALTNDLEEKAVEEIVRPNRSDWRVIFRHKKIYDQKNASAIITVALNGDQIATASRSIDIPAEWQRTEAEQRAKKMPFTFAQSIAVFALVLLALSGYVRKHQGRKFRIVIAIPWLVLIAVGTLVDALLWLDSISNGFQVTSQWNTQLAYVFLERSVVVLVVSSMVVIALQQLYAERPQPGTTAGQDILLGTALAVILAGFNGVISFFPSNELPALNTADIAAYIPWLATLMNGIKDYFALIAILILALGIVRFCRSRMRLFIVAALVVVWWLATTFSAREMGLAFASQGVSVLAGAMLVWLIARQQLGAAIVLLGVSKALHRADVASAIYPNAWLHALAAGVVLVLIAYGLVLHWRAQEPV